MPPPQGGVAGKRGDAAHLDRDAARWVLGGQRVKGDDAPRGEQERHGERDEALMQGEGAEPLDHGPLCRSRMPPVVTTRSAGVKPSSTSTRPSNSAPVLIGRGWYSSLPCWTRTKVMPSFRWIALCGSASTMAELVSMATLTNISALSARPRFRTTARTLRVRESLSTASPTFTTLPAYRSPGQRGRGTDTGCARCTRGTSRAY